jgi:hemolysin activation/secretion protein
MNKKRLFMKSVCMKSIFFCHPRESGDLNKWIPAFAGMTLVCWISFIFMITPVYAQNDTEIEKSTRQIDILNRPEELQKRFFEIPEEPVEPEAEEVIPVPEREKKIFIKEIKLFGCESVPCEVFAPLIKPYENREVTLSELEGLARAIQQEYLKRGIMAVVFVPEQKIMEGIVVLRVLEVRMGDLITREHKYFNNKRLNYYWRIPKGGVIKYGTISKSVQLMNKNPDREVRADLRPGKEPGTTDVILTAETRLPVHFVSTFDNEGSESTGKFRTGVGIRHNNLLGIDDTFLSEYIFGKDFDGFFVYHSFPVTPDGASVLYGYSHAEAEPPEEINELGIRSEINNVRVSLQQDIFRNDNYLGMVFCGFDAKNKSIALNTGTFNKDKLRILSLGGNLVWRKTGIYNTLFLAVYRGIDALGSTPKDNPLSSRGAGSEFTKFNMEFSRKSIVFNKLRMNLSFKGQASGSKLTTQEEFSLGGSDSVRGYPSGDYLADNAFTQSAEILAPLFFIPERWRENVLLITFIDHGWGNRRAASPAENESVDFTGAGAGLRVRITDYSYLLFQWAFPLGDEPVTESADSQFYFSGTAQF